MNETTVAEADLGFRRMHVDVDLFGVALEEQERKWVRTRGHEIVVRRGDGMEQQTVANQAAIDEDIDGIAVPLLHLRAREEAREAKEARRWVVVVGGFAAIVGDGLGGGHAGRRKEHFPLAYADFHKLVEHLATEYLVHALLHGADRSDVQQFRGTAGEDECLFGVRQAVMRDERGDMRQFGGLGAQEFAAGGDVVEKIADGDDGAAAERGFFAAQHLAAGDFNARAGGLFGGAGFEQQPGDGRDGGKRFAAKSEGGDGEQIFDIAQLAGGVALEGQQGVVAEHAAAIVDDADEAAAAGFHFHADVGGAGVEGVFEELLHDGGGPFDHFSSGDFIGDLIGEDANAAQVVMVAAGGGEPAARMPASRRGPLPIKVLHLQALARKKTWSRQST